MKTHAKMFTMSLLNPMLSQCYFYNSVRYKHCHIIGKVINPLPTKSSTCLTRKKKPTNFLNL